MYALAKSQACPDGNKRIALILTLEFLALNGSTLEMPGDQLADLILSAAESQPVAREVTVLALGEQLQPTIVPLTTEEL